VQLATHAPETTGRIGSVTQKLVRASGTGGWLTEDAPFNALYNSLGQLTSFTALGHPPALPVRPHPQLGGQCQAHQRHRLRSFAAVLCQKETLTPRM
jgi:hypothetical protein